MTSPWALHAAWGYAQVIAYMVYKDIENDADASSVQCDFDRILAWDIKWHMNFVPQKMYSY